MSKEQVQPLAVSIQAADEYELQEPLERNDELPSANTAAVAPPDFEAVVIQPAQLAYQPVSTVTRQAAARSGSRDRECTGDEAMKLVLVVVLIIIGFLLCGPFGVCCVHGIPTARLMGQLPRVSAIRSRDQGIGYRKHVVPDVNHPPLHAC